VPAPKLATVPVPVPVPALPAPPPTGPPPPRAKPERRVELRFADGTVLRLPADSALAEQMLALAGSVAR